ncbi:protein Wnt-5b isoform X2 [Exaiptasia diaphana]|nr:protein Wnt-5b isoform X2 [Exaiptasia diaphana]XP_020904202.1 protein Wnt-5b isoform X2 [Exaiptasia diaphana]XP_020904203.1 protein Wnt-5b isoform X2 [Exaiptasia diaphana]XP_028515919.1 protein Wnt-5b isoform X2 [Exaiptasia diaphana]KXJ12198.1 Protein Wnt-5b [Exaiptasia diaphana]
MKVRRKARKVPFFLLLMVMTSFFHAGHCVWSFNPMPLQVYLLSVKNPKDVICGYQDLSPSQRKICEDHEDQVTSVGEGVKMAIAECQHQFQYRRWNCSVPKHDGRRLLIRITNQDTREAAFTYAITSAAVVWALARACAEGNFSKDECSCSRERRPDSLKEDYMWGGCGDNIIVGTNFSKRFLDEEENDNLQKADRQGNQQVIKDRALMNSHNNEVGRLIVAKLSVIECKCHGVSGSCNLKTCWRQLSEFREIGNKLHDKYDAAVSVYSGREDGLLKLFRKKVTRSYIKRDIMAKPGPDEMVYLKPSPNFCYRNDRLGIYGPKGRKCIKGSPGTDGCNILCCDRGYTSKWVTVEKRCKCKFKWCCKVTCKKCLSRVMEHTCN